MAVLGFGCVVPAVLVTMPEPGPVVRFTGWLGKRDLNFCVRGELGLLVLL